MGNKGLCLNGGVGVRSDGGFYYADKSFLRERRG